MILSERRLTNGVYLSAILFLLLVILQGTTNDNEVRQEHGNLSRINKVLQQENDELIAELQSRPKVVVATLAQPE